MAEGFTYLDPEYTQKLDAVIAGINGLNKTYGSTTPQEIYQHILTYAVPLQVEFGAIVPIGWKDIVLDGVLDPENGVNSDTDELTDWEEIDTKRIYWNEDGSIILPTIQNCIDFVEEPYAKDGLERYKADLQVPGMSASDFQKYLEYVLNNTRILPIYSDPTEEDSDGDGWNDAEDYYPIQYDEVNGLIYQSKKRMGIAYDNVSLADDLRKNDLSEEDILGINKRFKEQIKNTAEKNEKEFKNMCKLFFAQGNDNDKMVSDLIDVFIVGTNESTDIRINNEKVSVPIYCNSELSKRVENDEKVQNYFKFVQNEFVNLCKIIRETMIKLEKKCLKKLIVLV